MYPLREYIGTSFPHSLLRTSQETAQAVEGLLAFKAKLAASQKQNMQLLESDSGNLWNRLLLKRTRSLTAVRLVLVVPPMGAPPFARPLFGSHISVR